MRMALLFLSIAPPLVALAADPPPQVQMKEIERSVEDLAHSYFLHHPYLESSLTKLLSPQGVQTVVPEVDRYKATMNDRDAVMVKGRQLCAQLQKARTGHEFANALKQLDERERAQSREHAAQLLARLNLDDRRALEEFLLTEYRRSGTSSAIDYDALFAGRPFPSDHSNKVLRTACAQAPPATGAQS